MNTEILVDAIADVGYWRWWVSELPDHFQLEFGGVQLFIDPKEKGKPPSSLLALRFIEPSNIHLYTLSHDAPSDWFERLRNDEIDYFNLERDRFRFGSQELQAELAVEAVSVSQFFRDKARTSKISLTFAAHDVGLHVQASDLSIYSLHGKVEPADLPAMNAFWWNYWKDYWDAEDSDNPFPKDYACEVTIPGAEETT